MRVFLYHFTKFVCDKMTELKKYIYLHLAIIFVAVLLVFVSSKEKYLSPTPWQKIDYEYSHSQYVFGDKDTVQASDETVYAYASQDYLHGNDPTQINFEHPPLGKYLFSLSEVIFHNIYIINLL